MTPPELIATENIPMIWPIIAPRLQRTMEKLEFVEFSLNDVLGLLNLGQAQLWVANDGEMIMITRIGNYPEVKQPRKATHPPPSSGSYKNRASIQR